MPPSHQRIPSPSGEVRLAATARLHHLIEWLRAGRPLTTSRAASALGVSRRTIARDLAHLRDGRGLAIAYDAAEGTYTLESRHVALPFIPHPDLLPALLDGTLRPTGTPSADTVHLRFSRASVQAYEAVSGLDLSATTDAKGRLTVAYAVTDAEHLVRWVLSSGAEAEVIAPAAFRHRVAVEIRRMLAVYATGEGSAS